MKIIRRIVRCNRALACATLAFTASAHGGGTMFTEIGTSDLGLAGAGWAARAQDASTLFTNPAGMSQLDGSQIQTGIQALWGEVQFGTDAGTSPQLADDGSGGNGLGSMPMATFFYSHELSDQWSLGFGMFSYFGAALDYDNTWAGRYYVQDDAMLGLSFMPAVSYQVNEWLSVGAGLNAMYGLMSIKKAVHTLTADDGRMELQDSTWGFGADIGLMFTPREGTRIGITYLSQVDLDFSDTPEFSNLGRLGGALLASPSALDLGVTVPQTVTVSIYHELNSKWALLGNVGWQDWSEFGKLEVGVDSANPKSFTQDVAYQDTWNAALGVQYRASEEWMFSAGYAYDSSAVEDADRTVGNPMGATHRFGIGSQWMLNECTTLGAAYEYVWMGDLPTVQESNFRGNLSGKFEDAWLSFFNVSLTHRF